MVQYAIERQARFFTGIKLLWCQHNQAQGVVELGSFVGLRLRKIAEQLLADLGVERHGSHFGKCASARARRSASAIGCTDASAHRS